MDERIQKIQELLGSEKFGDEVKDIETTEGFQEAFRRNGVEMTPEEVESVLLQVAVANGEELDEDQLDMVSGGFGLLTVGLVVGGCILVSYGLGWAAGRYLRNKSGVCH